MAVKSNYQQSQNYAQLKNATAGASQFQRSNEEPHAQRVSVMRGPQPIAFTNHNTAQQKSRGKSTKQKNALHFDSSIALMAGDPPDMRLTAGARAPCLETITAARMK
jgi:hypothetical protein